MWVLTVASLRNSVEAISALESPRAISFSTSSSRSVSWESSAGGPEPGGGRRTNSSTRRRVIAGARSASPAATRRTASASCSGRTSLSRKRSEERRVGKECRSRCDWSSDVCSSDLLDQAAGDRGRKERVTRGYEADGLGELLRADVLEQEEIGRASCRERV